MVTEVVHENDLLEKVGRRTVDDAGDGSKKNGVRFVMEDDHHRRRWKIRGVSTVDTPAGEFRISLSLSHSLSLSLSLSLPLKHTPWISGIWDFSIERNPVASKLIKSIILEPPLLLFLFDHILRLQIATHISIIINHWWVGGDWIISLSS